MRKIKYSLGIASLVLFAYSCTNVCQECLEKKFRPLEYNMVVTGKYIDVKFYKAIGREASGKIDTTEESALFQDIYNIIEIGDTLRKEKGKLDVYIIKKDTTYVFPYFCN
ncbi:MAG: hypothetical protein HXX18_10065 [Bacteroidetes bacterium]|nr:hypothetical protein [Bacteroidota bacterium]